MKYIKYQINNPVNIGTEDSPKWIDNLFQKSIIYSEHNEEIAKREAHNGEYEIYDDGQPDPSTEPSQLDRVESQIAYLAIITGNEEILEV